VAGVCPKYLGRNTFLRWDMMWYNLQQKELRCALLKSTINRSNKKGVKGEEDNVALASKGPNQGQGKNKMKKDLSMFKCFRCHEINHYNTQFLIRKKEKKENRDQAATSTVT